MSEDEVSALATLKPHMNGMRASSMVTHFMSHGALLTFLESDTPTIKCSALEKIYPKQMIDPALNANVEDAFKKLRVAATFFFKKLESTFEYEIPSALMSYLTFPSKKGKMYSEGYQPSDLPAAITFMGQFIDHDLTKNATNLVDHENDPGQTDDDGTGGLISPRTPDGRFVLKKLDSSNNAYDVCRTSGGDAMIEDGRNDENQMILQVHLLIMRVYNLLIKEKGMSKGDAQKETIYNWQSVVLNDHQKSVLDETTLRGVLDELKKEVAHPGSSSELKYKRDADGMLRMPHEFAIGFRYGHSQLRNEYFVARGKHFPLFDNLDPGPRFKDLRGGRPLESERAIDWPYFVEAGDIEPGDQHFSERRSNRLDTKIASDVFDLPESAVPDVPTKFLGNLPQRNLIRSREIGLTSGEKLFDFFFGQHGSGKLKPEQVEHDEDKRQLFELQADAGFQTPLWYYILKEAEVTGGRHAGLRLGKLGSRLVAEVVGGAIYYNPDAYVHDPAWKSAITGTDVVKLKDLAAFIHNKDAT